LRDVEFEAAYENALRTLLGRRALREEVQSALSDYRTLEEIAGCAGQIVFYLDCGKLVWRFSPARSEHRERRS